MALRLACPVNVWLPPKMRLGSLKDASVAVRFVLPVADMFPAPLMRRFTPGAPTTFIVLALRTLALVRLLVFSVKVPLTLVFPVVVMVPAEVSWNCDPPFDAPRFKFPVPALFIKTLPVVIAVRLVS